jgi:hypothetical protein
MRVDIQFIPLPVGDGYDAPAKHIQDLLYQPAVAGKAELEGVFQHQRQEQGRGLAAQDGTLEACRQ